MGSKRTFIREETRIRILEEVRNIDYPELNGTSELFNKEYSLTELVRIADKSLIWGLKENGDRDLYNFETTYKIISIGPNAEITYFPVAGELFIKVTEGDTQSIYDDEGVLIEKSVKEKVEVVFSGTGPILLYFDKATGKIRRNTLELYSA